MVAQRETSIGNIMEARRTTVYRHADMLRLLNPKSVAVIGASTRAGSFGERVLNNLARFDGRYYAVNARYDRIGELPCYPSVSALPEVPDCAGIITPREQVETIVRECASAGVGGAIVFASGYAEVGKPERIEEQERLAAIARDSGMRIVGPNCIGVVNTALTAELTFMSITPIPPPRPRAIGLISQSGALGMTLAQACVRGVSFSHVMTSGNSCDVDMADYVSFLVDEPGCGAIACVFEGMADPQRLLVAAEMAWRADKPLVVFKMATGEQGAAAAMSHTGSLAGSEAAYRAAFRRTGAILVDDYEALIETAAFFAKAPPMRARGVCVLATSGGAAIMAADRAEQHAVPLPQPDDAVRAILESHIPEFGAARNPCDVTAQVMTQPGSLQACAEALLGHPEYGALVVPAASSALRTNRSPTTGTPYSASTAFASRSVSARAPAARISAAAASFAVPGDSRAAATGGAARNAVRQCQAAKAAKQLPDEWNSATLGCSSAALVPGPSRHSLSQMLHTSLPYLPARSFSSGSRAAADSIA
jgi:acyl-CoA synthetase (NDP forming)